MSVEIRQASLDDTKAISALFCARIPNWQRINPQGKVEDVPYEALTIYERWTHGGAWMSVETGAIALNHLLLGAGIPLVAQDDKGRIVGYVEAYHSVEAEPFGKLLHVADLLANDEETERSLIEGLTARAKTLKCQHVTITRVGGSSPYDERFTLKPLSTLRRFNLPARQGQIFYRAVEHSDTSAAQISGWVMPVGRLSCSRQQWETLWPQQFDTLPEIRQRKTARRHFAAAGQDALMFCRENLYDPRRADVSLWSPKPLTAQLVSAVRDWAHREGYRTLVMSVEDDVKGALGTDAEDDGYTQETCAITLPST
ncbi:MAG TPA: hypothetical protein VHD90_21795 [Phototrophicaceae bacterium]|nr:hypothetical protein [Phototrophicaceae bacterium]